MEPGKSSLFEEEDGDSESYRWRQKIGGDKEKRIKFIIFTNMSTAPNPSYFIKREIRDEEDEWVDVDHHYFKTNFIEKQLYWKGPSDIPSYISEYKNKTKQEMFDILEEMKENEEKHTELEPYDCYFFLFLTFMSTELDSVDKIHFHDGTVSLDEIWEKVSNIPVMVNKPKIFLVQADDIALLQEYLEYHKGGDAWDVVSKTIPTDADRLTIVSTIPSVGYVENNQPSDGYVEKNNQPSFLIHAFVEEVTNNKQGIRIPHDLWSLTVKMNRRVSDMIANSKVEKTKQMRDKGVLQIPCSTSTLTKLFYI